MVDSTATESNSLIGKGIGFSIESKDVEGHQGAEKKEERSPLSKQQPGQSRSPVAPTGRQPVKQQRRKQKDQTATDHQRGPAKFHPAVNGRTHGKCGKQQQVAAKKRWTTGSPGRRWTVVQRKHACDDKERKARQSGQGGERAESRQVWFDRFHPPIPPPTDSAAMYALVEVHMIC